MGVVRVRVSGFGVQGVGVRCDSNCAQDGEEGKTGLGAVRVCPREFGVFEGWISRDIVGTGGFVVVASRSLLSLTALRASWKHGSVRQLQQGKESCS